MGDLDQVCTQFGANVDNELDIHLMKPDPVISEIRRVREAYAKLFAGDVRAMLADIRGRQLEGGHVVVSREPKRAKQSPA